ncbi:hypothetical protein MMPV_003605 [Pyropia vietnamensis]
MGSSKIVCWAFALLTLALIVTPATAVETTDFAAVNIDAADKESYTHVQIGKGCGYRLRCPHNAVCYKQRCTPKYGKAGSFCSKPAGLLCRYGHVCEGGRCRKWTRAGDSCARGTYAKCYSGLACILNKCRKWVAAGGSCADPSKTACYKGLACVKEVCKKWLRGERAGDWASNDADWADGGGG